MSEDFFGKDRQSVIDELGEKFPATAIKQLKKGNQPALDYVQGHTVIHRLNKATNNTWDFAIRDVKFQDAGQDRNGNIITRVVAHVALTIPTMGTREHFGVQDTRANGGEDLLKGAITDALKKAATLFGPGLELYGPDYAEGETFVNRIPNQQPQQQAPQRPQQAPQGDNRPIHTNTPPQGQNASQGHTGGAPAVSDKQWGMFNGKVQKLRLNGVAVAQAVAGTDPNNLTGGRGGGMSKCIDALIKIENGDMEIPNNWRLEHEDVAQPAPAGNGSGGGGADTIRKNWMRNIRNAQSSTQLDSMWESIQRAGLGDDPEIVSLMGEREEQLLNAQAG